MPLEKWTKDPDATERIRIPYDRRFGNTGVAVTGSAWSATPAGLTFSGDAIDADGLGTTVLVSGGTVGDAFTVTNQVSTSDGQTLDYSIIVEIKEE